MQIMDKTPQEYLLSITTVLSVLLVYCGAAGAQTRALPKAQFSNYSGAPLPASGGGLRLQQGQERPRNAPPEVYNPGEPKLDHKLVRWESRFMPLRVYISPGRKLFEEPISQINAQRPQEVLQLLRTDPGLSSLAQCAGWEESMNSAVKSGIEQWKEFEAEGLFSFVIVDDPTAANIMFFWAERFTGDESAGGVSTGGNTVAVLYDANEVHRREASLGGQPLQGTPVIIELQALTGAYEKLQARAAHEFGHALGIKEHSPYNQDLMCVNGIAHMLSPSDKATIRWLYHQNTPYVMLPPVLPRGADRPPVQQAAAAGTAGESDSTPSYRPGAGGYRIHINKPNRVVDVPSADDGFSAGRTPEFAGSKQNETSGVKSSRQESKAEQEKEAKKSERKAKHRKEEAEPPPAAAGLEAEKQAPARPKASEGY